MENEAILYALEGLPPFPETALKVIKSIKDPYCSAKDLVEIIQYDQSLTANILRLVNSAYYGLQTKVSSLNQAIAYLGSEAIVDILFISGSLTYFNKNLSGYGTSGKDMLIHSVSTALLCRIFGERLQLKDNSIIFTTGLLHDIGKVVLNSFIEDKYDEILELVNENHYSFVKAEREILGMDHAEVGGKLGDMWGFSNEIIQPISLHHQFEASKNDDIATALVFLSDHACFIINGNMGADIWSFKMMKKALDRCGLGEEDLDNAIQELKTSLGKFQDLIS